MSLKKVINKNGILKLIDERPQWGVNYNVGHIGFSNNNSAIAKAIKWGTKYDKQNKIEATHALIIINEHECIEALMGKGVVISPLSKYFDSEEFNIVIKAPKEYNATLGKGIVNQALEQLGAPYSAKVIFMSLCRGLVAGHIIDLITKDKLWDHFCKNRIGRQTFICSGLVAYCLQKMANWKYSKSGSLKRDFSGINPVELLYDTEIFEDFDMENTEI